MQSTDFQPDLKFAPFKVNDDFIFPLDSLHLALEMRELELKHKKNQQ